MTFEIRVAHVIAGLHPRSGGPSRVVVDVCDELARRSDIAVTLLAQSRCGEQTVSSSCVDVRRLEVASSSSFALRFGLPMRDALKSAIQEDRLDLIHNHGLWMGVNYWAARLARSNNIPLVVQTHGMLSPWALKHKAWKKKIALALFQKQALESADVLCTTSESEYIDIRSLGYRRPIAVLPNGVDLDSSKFSYQRPINALDRQRVLLFLGRLYPVKGLPNLLHAWAQARTTGWKLRIAGPDEANHLSELLSLTETLGIGESVEFLGDVPADQKSDAYRDADLFVLPSFTENFGVVVAEALAHGLPVITTHGTPWRDLVDHSCGWWIEIGVAPLVEALREATALSNEELSAMGARGRVYVQRYGWQGITRQTADVYRWVLGRGSKPDCLRLD